MILNNAEKISVGNKIVEKIDLENTEIYSLYRKVEYIKSTGTQFIITDIVLDYEMRLEADMVLGDEVHSFSDPDLNCHPFGGDVTSGSWRIKCDNTSYQTVSENLAFYVGYGWNSSIGAYNTINVSNITYRNTAILQRGTSYWGSLSCRSDFPITVVEDPTEGIAIFGFKRGATCYAFQKRDMTLYNFKIYRDQSLLCNLIPMERKSDGELGLYDTINRKFYVNSGTGTFIKGAYIN